MSIEEQIKTLQAQTGAGTAVAQLDALQVREYQNLLSLYADINIRTNGPSTLTTAMQQLMQGLAGDLADTPSVKTTLAKTIALRTLAVWGAAIALLQYQGSGRTN